MNQPKGLRILYIADLAILMSSAAITYHTYATGRIRETILCVTLWVVITIVFHFNAYRHYGLEYQKYLRNPSGTRDLILGFLALAMAGASVWVMFLGQPVIGVAGCAFFGLGGVYQLLRKPLHRNSL
jgi:TctA family transporter